MTSDLLSGLAQTNLAGSAAILAVLAVRNRARALLGVRTAYALWLIVPAAMLATLAPARTIVVPAPVMPAATHIGPAPTAESLGPIVEAAPGFDLSQALLVLWLAGAAVSLVLLAVGQRRALARFGRIAADEADPSLGRASNPEVGPALVGVFRPRVVVPADFEARFEVGERAMILAHERAHLARGDAPINALIALVQAANWFNPLIHLGARCLRVDQELACDAVVIGRHPAERRTYAEALLKTQLAQVPLPLGCDWPVRSQSLLEERIEMLAQPSPGRARLLAGAALVAVLSTGAGLAAWSAEPPVTKVQAAPATPEAVREALQAAISQALKDGATAKDIARLMQAAGRDIVPDTAAWAKLPRGGFGLAYKGARGNQQFISTPGFAGYTPPGGVDGLPTVEQALGPPPPPGPMSPAAQAIARMVLDGRSAREVYAAMLSAGWLKPQATDPPMALDPSTTRFVRVATPQGGILVGVTLRDGAGASIVSAIRGTESYRGMSGLPTEKEIIGTVEAPTSAPASSPAAPAAVSPQVRSIRDAVQAAIAKERARHAALPAPGSDAERILRMRELHLAAIRVLAGTDFMVFPEAERQAAMIAASAPFEAVNAENEAALLKLAPAGGWFTRSKYGDRAAQAAVQLTMNFEPAVQGDLVGRIEPLVKAGEVQPEGYAALFDRVENTNGRLQRYGTLNRCDGGKWRALPMEDPDQVEQRRASIGMAFTFAENLKLMQEQAPCVPNPTPPPPGMRLD